MSKRKRIVMYIMLFASLAIVVVSVYTVSITNKLYRYNRGDEILYNPMMGFAPNADYIEAVGANTLVYVDVTWRELEPLRGQYEFATIAKENHLERWKREGKKVVFRFVCDVPGEREHMDIPDWLYEETKDGAFYDSVYGKGYAPEYENPLFIEYHKKAIQALGEEYGRDSFFCFIEVGSLGHWGEWHVKQDEFLPLIPSSEICNEYVKHYVEAFPKAKLLMRRPFEAVTRYNLGVFNDMTGERVATEEWLQWIAEGGTYLEPKQIHQLQAVPQIWNTRPVGGEFTSSYTMEELLTVNRQETLGLLEKTHMTFIGPKCPIANRELVLFQEEVKQVLNKVGYRYGVSSASITYNGFRKRAKLSVTLENYGVAPMYFDWPVYIYLLNEENQVISKQQLEISLCEITQNESREVQLTLNEQIRKKNLVKIAIGIENPETNQPEVALDMDTIAIGKMYVLNKN